MLAQQQTASFVPAPSPFDDEETEKRKTRRKAKSKLVQPLDTQFDCPICHHERVCQVKLDKERSVGFVSCRVCLEDFQSKINCLSEVVDVYAAWIEACEQAKR